MKRLLILLIIGCIALFGAELTKLHLGQGIDNQKECDWMRNSCGIVLLKDNH